MSSLRIIGIIVGSIGFFFSFRFFRGKKWNRETFLLLFSFSAIAVAISINPNIVNIVQRIMNFEQVEQGRILALLVSSTIVSWFFVIYLKNAFTKQKVQFDQLVRALSRGQDIVEIEKRLINADICILIPAFNESDNLKELLKQIPDSINEKKVEVLVVDDCSEDETYKTVLRYGFNVIQNPINRGGGAALRLGYDILISTGVDICVTMDADCQHNPEEISALVTPIIKNEADIVIGSRILGDFEKDNFIRFCGVRFFSFVVSSLTAIKITDPSSGFRAFNMKSVKRVPLYEDQYHTSEMIITAAKMGIPILEVPITILKRKHGKSKKGKNLKYGLYFAKTIIKSWWR